MVQNIDSILQRGERLDLLVDKTDTLAGQAYAFRRGARAVRRQQWWKNTRITILTGFVLFVSAVSPTMPQMVVSQWQTLLHHLGNLCVSWRHVSLATLTLQLIVYLFIAQFCGLSLTQC